jgi:uncharacterized protein YuzE
MKLSHDLEDDIASFVLVDEIVDGEIAQDVGPQLTPNRQSVTMSYDGVGNLLRIEFWAASRILRPETLISGSVRLTHDPDLDIARLHLTDGAADDTELMVVGPQLTPTADRLLLAYDPADYLVYVEVEGADRVLRAETLAAAS